MKKRGFLFVIATAMIMLLSACGSDGASSAEGDEVTVRIGIQGKIGILPYAREHKLFEEAFAKEGVKIEWSEFTSGPPHFEALSAGRLDFGATGGTPVIAGQVANIDFRAIAVTSDGKTANSIVIPKGSTIKELADLKGKKIAVAKGSSAFNFLYFVLDHTGLTDKDIEIIQLQPDEARPALDNGSIDAWATWEPYATTAVFQTGAEHLVTGEDLNITTPSFLISRTAFTEEHPELTVLFLKTYEEVRQYYMENVEKVSEEIATTENLDVEIIQTILEKVDNRLEPTTGEFARAHQEQADFLYEVGGVNKQVDTSEVIDNHFIEEALKEVKETE